MLDIRDFGAVADGKTVNTKYIQAAVDAASAQGGGRVLVPAGVFLTGTIWLKANVDLHLEMGAVLRGSPNLDDYCRVEDFPQNHKSLSEEWNGAHLIVALEQDNVALTGLGTLDAQGELFFEDICDVSPFRPRYAWPNGLRKAKDKQRLRPGQMCFFCECTNVRVTDLALVNSCCWTVFIYGCSNVFVRGLRIENGPDNANTDGIDIDLCDGVTIADCIIKTGDDALTLRGNPRHLKNKDRVCENITITNCVLDCSVCGFRIGVGDGVIRHAAISNIVLKRVAHGFLFQSAYTNPSTGTTIHDIAISNIQMHSVANPLYITSGAKSCTAVIHDIDINGIYGECYSNCVFNGSDITEPNHIRIRNMDVKIVPPPRKLRDANCPRSFLFFDHVRDIELDNVEIRWLDHAPTWENAVMQLDADVRISPSCKLPQPPQSLDRRPKDAVPLSDLDFMLETVKDIYESDRHFSYDSMWTTCWKLEDLMRSMGMTDVHATCFPSDGVTDHGGWIMPLGWNPHSGILERILPDGTAEKICSYDDTPCSLMLYSRSADVTAEVATPDAPDLKGKLVLVTDHNVTMPEDEGYFARGAVGVLCSSLQGPYWKKPGQEHLEDACQWCNYMIPYRPVEGSPFGFSLTPNQGRMLEKRLQAGEKVILHARIDADVRAGKLPMVTGLLPGDTDEEILLTGHLFEQGANDNASGVAQALAVVRALSGKRHKRGVRVIFTHEIKSLQAYLNLTDKLPNFKAGLNADMVAVSADRHAHIGPSSAPFPTYVTTLLLHILEKHGCTADIGPSAGMDTMLCDPFFKVPMVCMDFMDDPNYHKSSDTPDRLNLDFYQRTFHISLEFTAMLVDAGIQEAKEMAWYILQHEARQPHPKGEKPAFARNVLLKRLDSVMAFADTDAEKADLADFLAPLKDDAAAMYKDAPEDTAAPEPPADIADALAHVFPVKNFKGLFSFEKYWHRADEFPAIKSLIGGWHACAWIELAFMWSDGSRSALQIWRLLRDHGMAVDATLFNAMLDFLLDENYLVPRS